MSASELMELSSCKDIKNEKLSCLKECAICTGTLRDARLLPCFHSFCLTCLKGFEEGKATGDEINCPICRKGFTIPDGGLDSMPRSDFINKLIALDKVSREGEMEGMDFDSLHCDHCLVVDRDEPAAGFCLDCAEHLCDTCLKRHKSIKSTEAHKCVALNDKPSSDELIKLTVSTCQEHPNHQIDFFCYDCKVIACAACFIYVHRKHKCGNIERAAEKLGQFVDEKVKEWNGLVKGSGEPISQIDSALEAFDEKMQGIERNIATNYEEAKKLLDTHYKNLVENLKGVREERTMELNALKEKGEQELLQLESFEQYWNVMKCKGSVCDIVQAASYIQKLSYLEEKIELGKEREQKVRPDYFQIEFEPTKQVRARGETNFIGEIRKMIKSDFYLCPDWLLLRSNTTNAFKTGVNHITGMAVKDNKIFIVAHGNSNLLVYDAKNLSTPSRQIEIPNMTQAEGLVYNDADGCLYVSNSNPSYIYKISTADYSITGWALPTGHPTGLSISKGNNLLVSYSNLGQIHEFSATGQMIRKIKLKDEAGRISRAIQIMQAIELTNGQFIVVLANSQYGICLVDSSGKIIPSTDLITGNGMITGSTDGERELLHNAIQKMKSIICNELLAGGMPAGHSYSIEIDQNGNFIVSDLIAAQLKIYNSSLKQIGTVILDGQHVFSLGCFCWDRKNKRLLMAGSGNGTGDYIYGISMGSEGSASANVGSSTRVERNGKVGKVGRVGSKRSHRRGLGLPRGRSQATKVPVTRGRQIRGRQLTKYLKHLESLMELRSNVLKEEVKRESGWTN